MQGRKLPGWKVSPSLLCAPALLREGFLVGPADNSTKGWEQPLAATRTLFRPEGPGQQSPGQSVASPRVTPPEKGQTSGLRLPGPAAPAAGIQPAGPGGTSSWGAAPGSAPLPLWGEGGTALPCAACWIQEHCRMLFVGRTALAMIVERKGTRSTDRGQSGKPFGILNLPCGSFYRLPTSCLPDRKASRRSAGAQREDRKNPRRVSFSSCIFSARESCLVAANGCSRSCVTQPGKGERTQCPC